MPKMGLSPAHPNYDQLVGMGEDYLVPMRVGRAAEISRQVVGDTRTLHRLNALERTLALGASFALAKEGTGLLLENAVKDSFGRLPPNPAAT